MSACSIEKVLEPPNVAGDRMKIIMQLSVPSIKIMFGIVKVHHFQFLHKKKSLLIRERG